jgi:hypothetical protein
MRNSKSHFLLPGDSKFAHLHAPPPFYRVEKRSKGIFSVPGSYKLQNTYDKELPGIGIAGSTDCPQGKERG